MTYKIVENRGGVKYLKSVTYSSLGYLSIY